MAWNAIEVPPLGPTGFKEPVEVSVRLFWKSLGWIIDGSFVANAGLLEDNHSQGLVHTLIWVQKNACLSVATIVRRREGAAVAREFWTQDLRKVMYARLHM